MNLITGAVHQVKQLYRHAFNQPTNEEEEKEDLLFAIRLVHFLYWVHTFDAHLAKSLSTWQKFIVLPLFALFLYSGPLYYAYTILNGTIVFDIGESMNVFIPLGMHSAAYLFRPIFVLVMDEEVITTLAYISKFKAEFNAVRFESEKEIFVDRQGDENSGPPTEILFRKQNISLVTIWLLLVAMGSIFSFVTFPQLYYILGVEDRPPKSGDFYTLFPFYDRIRSPVLYFVVCNLASLIGWWELNIGSCHLTFLYTIACIMKYNALDISEKVNTLSQNFTRRYEKTDSEKRLRVAFEEDVIRLIKEYKKFTAALENVRVFAKDLLAWCLSMGCVVMFASTAILRIVPMGMVLKIRFAFISVYLMICLFSLCAMAKIFDDIGESFRYTVYDLPWYYLSMRTRKKINIFQCEVFNHIEFKILRVYTVSMSVFPRLWSSVYSYTNILRTMTDR